jgi:hypothetical protein
MTAMKTLALVGLLLASAALSHAQIEFQVTPDLSLRLLHRSLLHSPPLLLGCIIRPGAKQ